jgi:hypothetical protein
MIRPERPASTLTDDPAPTRPVPRGAVGVLLVVGFGLLAVAFGVATSELIVQGNLVCGDTLAVAWRGFRLHGGELARTVDPTLLDTCVSSARHRVLLAAALAGGGLLLWLSAAVLQLSARNQATAES